MGVLCLFLLDMGIEAAKKADTLKKAGIILVSFGMIMPLIGGTLGIIIGGSILGFSVGGTFLLAISLLVLHILPCLRQCDMEYLKQIRLTT